METDNPYLRKDEDAETQKKNPSSKVRMAKVLVTDGKTQFWLLEHSPFKPNIHLVPNNKLLVKPQGPEFPIEVRRGVLLVGGENVIFLSGRKDGTQTNQGLDFSKVPKSKFME